MDEKKQIDYNFIIKNIESVNRIPQVESIYKLIQLFDNKWKKKGSICDLVETIELRAILKYYLNKHNLFETFEDKTTINEDGRTITYVQSGVEINFVNINITQLVKKYIMKILMVI